MIDVSQYAKNIQDVTNALAAGDSAASVTGISFGIALGIILFDFAR